MGRKNLKGAVSIDKDKNTIRLRWRYQTKRYSLNLFLYNKANLLRAKKVALVIENDLVSGAFDSTLYQYKLLITESRDTQTPRKSVQGSPAKETFQKGELVEADAPTSILKEFDRYIAAKSMDPHSDDLSSYYTQTRAMLKKWGDFDPEETPVLLSKEEFGPKTFNDRRNCLFKFFGWLVRKGKLPDNPLQEVSTRKRERNAEPRKPFTDGEVALMLDALKTDRFRKKSSRYTHSQYYPLVAFMIQTGVRNAEAIGLQVRDVLWESREIKICRALARTSKGTNEAARKEKGTKTNNVRYLPMNDFLADLLKSLCKGKQGKGLVFTNEMGRMIDDRMFQRRVFKPILKELKLQDRDLYACRHTFATRAVQAGLRAHEVAYLMGDNLQTVVNNYYHTERITTSLPNLYDRLISLKTAG